MKLQVKILLLILSITIISVVISAIVFFVQGRQMITQRVGDQLESVAILKQNHIEQFIELNKKTIEALAESDLIKSWLEEFYQTVSLVKIKNEEVQKSILQKLNEELYYHSSFFEFFILDLNGSVVLSTDSKQEQKIKSNQSFFIEGKYRTYTQFFYFCQTLRQPAITISTPIKDRQNNTIGVLAGRVNVKGISAIMAENSGLGVTGETYLINQFNYMVTNSRFEEDYALKKTIYTENAKNCINGHDGFGFYDNYIGIPVMSSYRWIPDKKVCLLAEISQKEALAPLKAVGYTIAIIYLGIIILVIILSFFFSRTIVKPLIKLRNMVIKFGRGEDIEKIEVNTKDEINDVALVFNKMVISLQKSFIDLKQERNKFETIAQNIGVGVIFLDNHGEVIFANQEIRLLIGTGNSENCKVIGALKTKFSDAEIDKYIEECIAGKPVDIPEAHINGSIFEICFRCVWDSQKNILAHIILIRDITSIKLFEHAKTEFIAITSHELRTPLTIIRGSAEYLLRLLSKKEIDQKVREMLDNICEATSRLLKIVNDLLYISAIEERKMSFKKEIFDIGKLTQKVVLELTEKAQQKKLSIIFTPSASLSSVLADKDRTRQALVNILENAIQYTDHGKIIVAIERLDSFIKIIVSDTGIGIPEDRQDSIFQKFHTIKERFIRSREYGSGMGLYISKMIVESMGGVITLERSTLGVGSVFSFTLPAYNAE
jgi:signal transduction histidine kinase